MRFTITSATAARSVRQVSDNRRAACRMSAGESPRTGSITDAAASIEHAAEQLILNGDMTIVENRGGCGRQRHQCAEYENGVTPVANVRGYSVFNAPTEQSRNVGRFFFA